MSTTPALPEPSDWPQCRAAPRPTPAQSVSAPTYPGNSGPLPTPVPVSLRTKFQKTAVARGLPASPQLPMRETPHSTGLPQSNPRKSFQAPVQGTTANSADAVRAPVETLALRPAFESIAAPPASPRTAPAPAVLSLHCAAPSRLCSMPPAVPAHQAQAAGQFARPPPNAKGYPQSSARTAKENSLSAFFLRPPPNPSAPLAGPVNPLPLPRLY